VIATLDESSYKPGVSPFVKDLHMGADHPVAWTRCVLNGRSFYSAMDAARNLTQIQNMRSSLKRQFPGSRVWAIRSASGISC